VLTAYAESDFKWNARSPRPVGASGYYSEGVFQQTLPWWKNDHFDVAASTNAFLDNFRRITGDAVSDCWEVQRWDISPTSLETQNYKRRIPDVARIIRERKVA